jgi:hypothetical protein
LPETRRSFPTLAAQVSARNRFAELRRLITSFGHDTSRSRRDAERVPARSTAYD